MAIKIEKQPNGKYKVRVWARHKDMFGKRKTAQKCNINTVAVAKQWALAKEDALSIGEDCFIDYTFAQLDKMYHEVHDKNMKETTKESQQYIRQKVLDYFGNVQAKRIDTNAVQTFVNKLEKTPNPNTGKLPREGTILRYYRYITAVLNWAVNHDKLEYNKVKQVELKKDDEVFEPTLLSPTQISEILSYFKTEYYNLYIPILIATMGTRRGESCGLKWENVDFENHTIRLDNNRTTANNKIIESKSLKTQSSKRLIVMSEFLERELLEHKKMNAGLDSPYVCANVFTGDTPTNPSYLTHAFHDVVKAKFGITMRLHDLRHCFNQLGYEMGIDDVTRSKMLGHSSVKTTNNVYTHFSIDKARDAMNVISEKINPLNTKKCEHV